MNINTNPQVIELITFTKREIGTLNESQGILYLCSCVPSDYREQALVAADALAQFMEAKYPPTEGLDCDEDEDDEPGPKGTESEEDAE